MQQLSVEFGGGKKKGK